MEKCILVPFDFSNEANFALDHAYELARITSLPIHLLYVVSNEKEVEEWHEELKRIADNYAKEHNYKVEAFVRAGNLFETIYNYGIEANAYLAVMGTHGIKTIKKAMKVIKKFVKIPFILVQRPINFGSYDKICVPIDDDKKSRAKFLWVKYLNNLFESKVFIIYPEVTDAARKAEINSNIMFATSIFEKDAIDFEVKAVCETNFADNLYDVMNNIEPDVVLFMTDKYKKSITELKRPRNIELSKKIPIMCVNPRTDIVKLGGFAY
ncbi:MAG TPA: universal stress protein [Bacteroidales bacterium]|nr:universal stress protein [Bacteroidales bacterium]